MGTRDLRPRSSCALACCIPRGRAERRTWPSGQRCRVRGPSALHDNVRIWRGQGTRLAAEKLEVTSRPYDGVMHDDTRDHEDPLVGGNASASVVRIGDTVRKPWLPTTERTVAYMVALRDRGIDLPEPHGRDDQGRLILDFVPGRLALHNVPLDVDVIRTVGGLVRSIHDASTGLAVPKDWDVLIPAKDPDLLCHNDLATWNLVLDDDRLVFIDWDGAGPSTRLWDLAYAAISFGHLFPDADAGGAATRLAAFVDGYGADDDLRAALPSTMSRRAEAMHQLLHGARETGREPWATMYTDGHGQHWRATAEFIASHHRDWRKAVARSSRH